MSKANRQMESKDPYPADTAVSLLRNSHDVLRGEVA